MLKIAVSFRIWTRDKILMLGNVWLVTIICRINLSFVHIPGSGYAKVNTLHYSYGEFNYSV